MQPPSESLTAQISASRPLAQTAVTLSVALTESPVRRKRRSPSPVVRMNAAPASPRNQLVWSMRFPRMMSGAVGGMASSTVIASYQDERGVVGHHFPAASRRPLNRELHLSRLRRPQFDRYLVGICVPPPTLRIPASTRTMCRTSCPDRGCGFCHATVILVLGAIKGNGGL